MSKQTVSLQPSDYVHLHNHTHHSLLDGMTKIDALVERVKMMGMEAVAMTDHGTLSGTIDFYKACKGEGIKPIIGMEAYVAARKHTDKEAQHDKARYHLIILAMNNKGYENLMRLSTIANLDGLYYKPRIDHDLLEKYNEGLIILSGCASGEVGESLKNGNYEPAKKIASWYKKIFGDRYYLEIQDHGDWEDQLKINEGVERLSKELDIPRVLTGDAHYLNKDDAPAHEILLCVGTNAYLSDKNRMSLDGFHLHVRDPNEIIEKWGDQPELITTSKAIADRCDVEIELGSILIPTFPTPPKETEKSYLQKLVYQGLAWRYGNTERKKALQLTIAEAKKNLPEDVLERAKFELSVIDNMGFNGYFLIVQDFINWGKDRGIIFGPGRGSAAGSIISYALNTTDLDPIHYDLLFERFLNPDRISMPDIDIDIQDTRRDEVIQYCIDKYGHDRVANIVTFGTMAARAAVRDVARVLEVPYAEADHLAKMIPPPVQGRHIPLAKSIQDDADLKNEYETNERAHEVIDFASRLEGTIRSHGVHAAGVVIAPDDLVKFAPLEMAQKGVISTQYPMFPIEDLGLLKMDFLGLSNLTTINNAMRIIKKVYKVDIDLNTLKLDDKKTYELFQRGDTTGVFQLESAGMKRYLKQLKPSVFDDIIAMVALYRPGPMQFIDSFIKRKHGKEKISYLHPKMENALSNTYGILVYQEQFMQISKDLAGFTGGQADTLRKAVGKKIMTMMKKIKPEFVEGAIKHSGADRKTMELFWDQLEEFANYCFNKSHAACYALISYWTAYLKAHFPDAFMAALMTSDQGDIDRLAIEIAEAQHMGLKVLSPDINLSFVEFSVVPGENEIRFGLAAVKGVGVGAVEAILLAREDGPFTSPEDFAKRVPSNKVNRRVWESLVKSGAFDSMGDRSDLLFNMDLILAFASKLQKDALSGQTDLFAGLGEAAADIAPSLDLKPAPTKHTEKERLTWERELLGLYLSSHPLDPYSVYLNEQTVPLDQVTIEADGKSLTVGGIISTVRAITTKNGSKMAFLKLEDKFGETEIIIFPKLYQEIGEQLLQDTVIRVNGRVNARNQAGNIQDEAKVVVDKIIIVSQQELDNYKPTGEQQKVPEGKKSPKGVKKSAAVAEIPEESKVKTIYIHVKDTNDHESLREMKKELSSTPGENHVILVLGEDKSNAIRLPFTTQISDRLIASIQSLYGPDQVVVK
ncbi:MAG: DNA polymerase III subunit alpha [Candidatus Saccharibacteria bacterium]|nr:DNA polymerase III subunit alpha [Candidatus Saccharibacteria bacterium]